MKLQKLSLNKKGLLLILVVCAVFVGMYVYKCGIHKVCGVPIMERVVRDGREMQLPNGTVYAEIVDTPLAREQGLSGRKGLSIDEGMLFVFEHPGKYGFWMKDMLFPIDIVWINEEGIVVHIERRVTPASYFEHNPPQTFINEPDATYVLELAEGQSETYGLYLGTKVTIGE